MQIFYPFSIQVYPNSYPGQDPNDCPKKVDISKYFLNQKIFLYDFEDEFNFNSRFFPKCNNIKHPDTYGNFRESDVVQIKLHWFWKVSYLHHVQKNLILTSFFYNKVGFYVPTNQIFKTD